MDVWIAANFRHAANRFFTDRPERGSPEQGRQLDFASSRVGFGRASSLWSGFPTQLLDKTRRA